ncbi:MAG: immunoglobulin domain-containing protein, partial [Verrucomicrobiae bacterium]|nr:immunoglobulin domain-containing protein [Verrucomicrobiae bacterium]
PIDHEVDGVDRYDGNWNMSLDTHENLDYLVAVSGSSLDVGWMTYGWMAVHRLDGSIASGNSSYKLPFREDDVEVDYSNIGGGTEPDFDSTESWVDVVPDATAPATQGKSLAFAAFANGGFGVFTVENVPATLVSSPSNQTAEAGSTVTLTANVTGSPNSFVWYHNGVPVPAAPYYQGYNKAALTIVGVTPSDAGSYQLKWTNPLSGAGETAAATLTVTGDFTRWAGASDIFPSNVDPTPLPGELVGDAPFTLRAGGLQAFDTLNADTGYTWGETSFYRYEQLAGDFDKRIRLVSLTAEPAGEEINLFARAGLMLRQSASANTPTLEIFAANPASASGNLVRVAGRGLVNQVYSQTLSRSYPRVSDNLPNQWLRVRRVGNAFSFYVGTNGTAWTLVAEQYQSFPSTVLFGAFASPDDASGASYAVAEFADYGDVSAADSTAPVLISGGTIDGQWVGLKFSEPIHSLSAGNPANYTLSQGTVVTAQTGISAHTVYLKVFGLTNDTFTVTVGTNVVDLAGNPVAANSTVTVKKSAWTSTDIGIIQNSEARPTVGDDPYVVGQSVAVSSDTNPEVEFVGGGSNGYDPGDFLHYLYRPYTGDFDVVVAVERFDRRGIAGGYANGGIHVRSALYREDDSTGADRTKVKDYVNVTYYEASGPGRPAIEIFRVDDGGNYGLGQTDMNINNELDGVVGYFGSLIGSDAAGNLIPNASPSVARWLRMTRVGDEFTASYSYDGVNWHAQTRAEETVVPVLPATVLVGFGFQNDTGYGTTYAGNGTFITNEAEERVWTQNESNYGVVRVSHFGDFDTAFPTNPPVLNVGYGTDGTVVLTWTGTGWTLQSAAALDGTFAPAGLPVNTTGDANTVIVTPAAAGYYRLSQ